MSEKIIVSICCLTYNHEKYIKDTINGILSQKTEFSYEIIIHDDCSTDGTRKIIKDYKEQYPDIIIPIFQEENQFSRGVKRISHKFVFPNARGMYIALCEGDDYWTNPNKLQKQVELLNTYPECSICFHNANAVSPDKISLGYSFSMPLKSSGICDFGMISGNFIPTASLVFRKCIINTSFPSWYSIGNAGDFPLILFLFSKGDGFFINEIMSSYRVRVPGSCTEKLNNSSKEEKVEFIQDRIEILNKYNEYTQFKYSHSIIKTITKYQINEIVLLVKISNRITKAKAIILMNPKNTIGALGYCKILIGVLSPKIYFVLLNSRVIRNIIFLLRKR